MVVALPAGIVATVALGATAVRSGSRYLDALPLSFRPRAISALRGITVGSVGVTTDGALVAQDHENDHYPLVSWAAGVAVAGLLAGSGLVTLRLRRCGAGST